MLGTAELREIADQISEEHGDGARADQRSPYLTTHFAMGLAVTRAAAQAIKSHTTNPLPPSLLLRR